MKLAAADFTWSAETYQASPVGSNLHEQLRPLFLRIHLCYFLTQLGCKFVDCIRTELSIIEVLV
jgi:hypothetical protein